MTNELSLWECPTQLADVREVFKKNLSEPEFRTFLQLGKATGLNPFLKEIWAVKYGDAAASIFIGRDGYRKSAQANPTYDWHHVDAAFSNDNFHYDVDTGKVTHTYSLKDRGALIGAYCIVKKRNVSRPTFVFVDLKEYTTGKSLWATKPITMIKKCAEAQCLRMAFQELFGGTYLPEEIEQEEQGFLKATVIEGTPMSQSFKVDDNLLQSHILKIIGAQDMDALKNTFADAQKDCKGDRDAINIIVQTKTERKKFLSSKKELDEHVDFIAGLNGETPDAG